MTFRVDVSKTNGLHDAWQAGLRALKEVDKNRITSKHPRKLTGSADLDEHLRHSGRSNEAVWDYVIALADGKDERLDWIEVHPASGGECIYDLERKIQWLLEWLSGDGKRLDRAPRRFIWIASGKSGFRRGAPQLRQLAAKGLQFVGEHYKIN